MHAYLKTVEIDGIVIGTRKRALNRDTVEVLKASIAKIGLRTPISVRDDGVQFTLMTGAHRLAAAEALGWKELECFVYNDGDETEAELWEIAENLHRAELSAMERDEQVARWIELTENKLTQGVSVSKGGRGNEGGIRAAANELNINREDARRAVKVASLSPAAKQAARDLHLDDNRSALLSAAKEKTPTAQVTRLRDHARKKAKLFTPKPRSEADIASAECDRLIIVWNSVSASAQRKFREFVLRAEIAA